ncbi:hypothetical protein Ga0100231_005625 [Opitutaceae bacterium TAV4]|nr:hypothetical protein Ga0100231_005625 [Opitutaceae bacterium TAV4]RRK02464.1 hypothetical protein Ga0100230_004840 [Opitutaceae bacterium TAV3]
MGSLRKWKAREIPSLRGEYEKYARAGFCCSFFAYIGEAQPRITRSGCAASEVAEGMATRNTKKQAAHGILHCAYKRASVSPATVATQPETATSLPAPVNARLGPALPECASRV